MSGHRGIHTGTFGYWCDVDGGNPRPADFSDKRSDDYVACFRYARTVNSVFRRDLPQLYVEQKLRAITAGEFHIDGTVWTTGSANLWTPTKNGQLKVHRDKNNLAGTFSAMSVLTRGEFSGGLLIFPKYGVAFDLKEGDVLLADVGELHGATSIQGDGAWERIVVILYFRDGLQGLVD